MTSNALRQLASVLRAGLPLRTALERWPSLTPGLETELTRVARAIRLGFPITIALRGLDTGFFREAPAVRTLVALHAEVGGDLAGMLDRLAEIVDRRDDMQRRARAMAAGMTTSARIIAVLPFFFLLSGPASGVTLLDPATFGSIAVGGLLMWTGLRWIRRLLPDVGHLARSDLTLAVLGAALVGGVDHHRALQACARHAGDGWDRVARRARLGMGWANALRASDSQDLVEVGEAIAYSIDSGHPASRAFEELDARLLARSSDRFEAAIRRAPVRMVLPLTLCLLPAYALIAAGPYLSALAA